MDATNQEGAGQSWFMLIMATVAPGRIVPAEPLGRRLAATSKLAVTWRAGALYAVAFGGYVAFSVYLPTYLHNAYGLAQTDAANRTAGFVLLAVAARPFGGWLSDRIGPVPVLEASLVVTAAAAAGQASTPALIPADSAVSCRRWSWARFTPALAAMARGSRRSPSSPRRPCCSPPRRCTARCAARPRPRRGAVPMSTPDSRREPAAAGGGR